MTIVDFGNYLKGKSEMRQKLQASDAALLLIDHQVGTMGWVRSIDLDVMKTNTRVLAKSANVLGMPVVLTSSMEDAAQGPLMPELREILPEAYASRVQRGGIVNCWEDEHFSGPAKATGKKTFIVAGVTTDVCLAPPAISAAADGFRVVAIVDASGSPTKMADDIAIRQMELNGVEVTATNAIVAELASDWSTPHGQGLMQVLYEEILSKMA